MNADEFSDALSRALGLCREAAGLKLQIEEMLEYVEDAIETARPGRIPGDLEALREIIASVGDVAAIGAKLPVEPPAPPPGSYPLPANVQRRAAG